MLVVGTITQISRYHFVKGKGIKEISRSLGFARNSVRKVIRSLGPMCLIWRNLLKRIGRGPEREEPYVDCMRSLRNRGTRAVTMQCSDSAKNGRKATGSPGGMSC